MALPLTTAPQAAPPMLLGLVQDDLTRESLRQAAMRLGWPPSGARLGGVAEAAALLQAGPAPDILVVDLAGEADAVSALDALAEVCDPRTRVVAIGAVNDVMLYRRLIQLGVSDYLVKPVGAEILADALQRAERIEPPEPAAAPAAARTIALIGARGGAGATTVAACLAWRLSQEQRLNTVLLDLDLQFGAVALGLDLEPGRGLREILSSPERIDSLLIGSAVRQAGERLRVLGAEEPIEADLEFAAEGLVALLDGLKGDAEAVVIDLPRRLDRLGRAAVMRADVVGIVTDLTLAGLRDTQRLLKALAGLKPEGRVLVVGNRAGGAPGEVPRADFERGIGAKLDVLAPFDAKAASAAAEQGKPLTAAAPSSPAAAELRRVADLILGETAAPAKPASLLQRLWGR